MLLLQYQKCSTCKKAAAWLKQNHIACEDRPIKEKNPTKEELAELTPMMQHYLQTKEQYPGCILFYVQLPAVIASVVSC